jgi:alanyl aminopeptidase
VQAEQPGADAPKLRLAGDVVSPLRYSLDLSVIPDQDEFDGSIDIDLSLKKACPVLWLNAEKLHVKQAVLSAGGKSASVKVVSTRKDYVGFVFDHAIGPGYAKLHIVFQGAISRKDVEGIFQVKDNGQWYVYTQFEAIAARRAFPCFDEPGYKVPWQLTLHVKKDQIAVSNTPIVSEFIAGDGMKTVRFAETKPLPSYLVAFAVGDMEFVEAGTAG